MRARHRNLGTTWRHYYRSFQPAVGDRVRWTIRLWNTGVIGARFKNEQGTIAEVFDQACLVIRHKGDHGTWVSIRRLRMRRPRLNRRTHLLDCRGGGELCSCGWSRRRLGAKYIRP
jgi:hypothetical protein